MTAHTSHKLRMCSFRVHCVAQSACYVTACHSCIVYSAWNPKDDYDVVCEFIIVQLNGFMSLKSYFDVTYIINITETTYSCQF
jgi:hypothetical protein